jgi:hypothetical protein
MRRRTLLVALAGVAAVGAARASSEGTRNPKPKRRGASRRRCSATVSATPSGHSPCWPLPDLDSKTARRRNWPGRFTTNELSIAFQFSPMPWKTPAAPTPSCSATCAGQDPMCGVAGRWIWC